MNLFECWRPLATALGWMVAHSLWQITFLFLVYRLIAWRWERHNRLLYAFALLLMACAAFWAVYTFETAWADFAVAPAGSVRTGVESFYEGAGAVFLAPGGDLPVMHGSLYRHWMQAYAAWAASVGWIWCLGALVFSLRWWGGFRYSQRLRRMGVTPAPGPWQPRCEYWRKRMGIRRRVQWLESTRVSGPLTLGFWKPVILFPAGLLLQLPPEQAELLLLHELAHIRRYDYLANLLQMALEICFFYHPLFWWLSRELRRRREYCCDDLVVLYTRNPILYARTLTDLQLSYTQTQNHFAMNALGKSAFARRILRIAGVDPETGRRSPLAPLLLVFIFFGAGLCWSAFRNDAQPRAEALTIVLPAKPAQPPVPVLAATRAKIPAGQKIEPPVSGNPDTLSPSVVAVQVDKMNVFYIGVDNPITVAVPGFDCSKLEVRLQGPGEIIPQGDCQYIVRVRMPGAVSLEVFNTDQGRQTQLGVRHFRAKRIPDPVAQLEDHASKLVSKADLEAVLNRPVSAILPYFDFDAHCEIVAFRVAAGASGSDVIEYAVQGNTLPDGAKAYFNTLLPGTQLYFTNIKVKCPGDAAARMIGDLVLRIVD